MDMTDLSNLDSDPYMQLLAGISPMDIPQSAQTLTGLAPEMQINPAVIKDVQAFLGTEGAAGPQAAPAAIAPQPQGMPQQQPQGMPQQQPQGMPQPAARPAPAQVPMRGQEPDINSLIPEPDTGDKIGAFLQGLGQGGGRLLPAIGGGMNAVRALETGVASQRARATATLKALIGAGASPQEAMAVILDPTGKALEKILPTLMPIERAKIEAETGKTQAETYQPRQIGEDQFGAKSFGVFNPATKRYEAVGAGSGGGGTSDSEFTPQLQESISRGVTGSALYDYMGSQLRSDVKAVAEGLRPYPSGLGANKGYWARVKTLADMVSNGAPVGERFKLRESFTRNISPSAPAANIVAMGQLAGHLDGMLKGIDKLDNYSTPVVNMARNAVSKNVTGRTSALRDFTVHRNAVATELGRVFMGGVPPLAEIREWKESFSENTSPEDQYTAAESALDLVDSRLRELQGQWRATMGDIPYPENFRSATQKLEDARTKVQARKAALGLPVEEKSRDAETPSIMGVPLGAAPEPRAPAQQARPPVAEPAQQAPEPTPGGGSSVMGVPLGGASEQPQPAAGPGQQGAAAQPGGGVPVVANASQIPNLPLGSYFSSPYGDIFQRIAANPGFVKVSARAELPTGPQGGGGAAAPSGQGVQLAGGVQAPAPGAIEFHNGLGYRFMGGDPANPSSWRPLNGAGSGSPYVGVA